MRAICGECKWHYMANEFPDFVCTNPDSEYCTDYTLYDDGCEHFEQRGIDNE